MNDVKFAFRQLLHRPRFALLAVLTLAIGIGATSAVFGLIQGVLLSPPPYARPDRLLLISPQRTDGTPRPEIFRLILGEGFRLVLLGLLLGVIVTAVLDRLLATFLFGVEPGDPLALAAAAFGFSAVALIACWLPAYRATRVDPIEALRYE